jgi:hypothetical protein
MIAELAPSHTHRHRLDSSRASVGKVGVNHFSPELALILKGNFESGHFRESSVDFPEKTYLAVDQPSPRERWADRVGARSFCQEPLGDEPNT